MTTPAKRSTSSLRVEVKRVNRDQVPLVKVLSHQAIFRFSPLSLASFRSISSTLLEVEISNCELTSADIVSDCVNARLICLSKNKITTVPKNLDKLKELNVFDLSFNCIKSFEGIQHLSNACSSLIFIKLLGNAIANESNYRSLLIGLVPSLCGLDESIATDAESLGSEFFLNNQKCQKNKNVHVDKILCSMVLRESADETLKYSKIRSRAIRNMHKCCSSAYVIQRNTREWLKQKKDNEYFLKFQKSIVRLQALARSFVLMKKLSREIESVSRSECMKPKKIESIPRACKIRMNVNKIQKWWTRCVKMKIEIQSCVRIQQWFRRSIIFHRGMVMWLCRSNIQGVVCAAHCVHDVRECLESYPSMFVKCDHMSHLASCLIPLERFIAREKDRKWNFFAKNSTIKASAQRSTSVLSFAYSSPSQRRQYSLLKRRGVGRVRKLLCHKAITNHDGLDNDSSMKDLYVLYIQDKSLLYKVYKYLRQRLQASTRLFFDVTVREEACTNVILCSWRGHCTRKLVSRFFWSTLLRHRAVIALQRWWRITNGLKRRFRLLFDINRACAEILSPSFYLDSWVYYCLLRCFRRPPHQQAVVSSFPEYGGVPVFEDSNSSDSGCLVMQPLSPAFTLQGAVSIPLQNASRTQRRRCIPRWVSWRPKRQLQSSAGHIPLSDHVILFSLLSLHCDPCIRSFDTGSAEESRKKLRVVELNFRSVEEARIRCAMIMLFTYDVGSFMSVTPFSRECILKRLKDKQDLFKFAAPVSTESESCQDSFITHPAFTVRNQVVYSKGDNAAVNHAVSPVECRVFISRRLPLWLINLSEEPSLVDIVRFLFLCECLDVANKSSSMEYLLQQVQSEDKASIKSSFNQSEDCNRPLFAPLRDYNNHVLDENGVSSSSDYSIFRRCERPAAVSFPLIALPKPNSPRKDGRKKNESSYDYHYHNENRFHRLMWTRERVLLWCSDFEETALDEASTASPRPHTAAEQASKSVESVNARLQTLTMSRAVKFSRPKSCSLPHEVTGERDDSKESVKSKSQDAVKQMNAERRERNERMNEKVHRELARRQRLVRKSQADRSGRCSRTADYISERSEKARNDVVQMLEKAKAASAIQSDSNKNKIRLQSESVRNDTEKGKLLKKIREGAFAARCALNSIAAHPPRSAMRSVRRSRGTQKKTEATGNKADKKETGREISTAPPSAFRPNSIRDLLTAKRAAKDIKKVAPDASSQSLSLSSNIDAAFLPNECEEDSNAEDVVSLVSFHEVVLQSDTIPEEQSEHSLNGA